VPLHFPALACTALYCTVLNSTVPHSTAQDCAVQSQRLCLCLVPALRLRLRVHMLTPVLVPALSLLRLCPYHCMCPSLRCACCVSASVSDCACACVCACASAGACDLPNLAPAPLYPCPSLSLPVTRALCWVEPWTRRVLGEELTFFDAVLVGVQLVAGPCLARPLLPPAPALRPRAPVGRARSKCSPLS